MLIAAFAPVLADMVKEWAGNEDMGHAFFVPLMSGYVVWQQREKLASLRLAPSWWGLSLVLWGAIQLLIGTLGVEFFLARTAFLISLTGVIATLGGLPLLRALAFPLVLLLFMIRIPAIIYHQITFPLQLIASRIAEVQLMWLGLPVIREGNVLELANQKLSVVEACSGIRSLLSLSFLAVVYAYMFDPTRKWMRLLLLVLAVPITIAANSARVTITGILSAYKPEYAQGFYHTAEGWVIFMVALVMLFAVHHLILMVGNRLAGARHGA